MAFELSSELRDFLAEAPAVRQPHVAFLRRAATALLPDASLLDVGAGIAPYRELFPHIHYLTCDWNHSIYDAPIDFYATAMNLPVAKSSFDAVLCTEVLEHVPDPLSAFSEFHRILKPGGRVWITVPFVWFLHEEPYDYYRYTSHGLRYLLERTGFSEIEITPLTDSFSTLSQLVGDLGWLMDSREDGHDGERGLVGSFMRQLSDVIGGYSRFDSKWILPLGYSAAAVRPEASS